MRTVTAHSFLRRRCLAGRIERGEQLLDPAVHASQHIGSQTGAVTVHETKAHGRRRSRSSHRRPGKRSTDAAATREGGFTAAAEWNWSRVCIAASRTTRLRMWRGDLLACVRCEAQLTKGKFPTTFPSRN